MCECEAHNGTPAFEERACVVSNENLGPRLYKITLAAPKTAAAIRPGEPPIPQGEPPAATP